MQSEWCCQSGTSGRPVDGGDVVHLLARSCAMRSRRGAQLVRLSSRGSIRSRSRARSTRWKVSAVVPVFGRVTSASMSTAVTHRLGFLHVEADGARWHTPRGALPEVSSKAPVVLSHYPVDNLYAHPEILDLLQDNSKHDVGTDTIWIRVGRRLF